MRTATSTGSTSLSLPPNSYIYNIVAVGEKLGVISSDDSLRIFDPQTLQIISDGIRCNAHEGLTCLERNHSDNNTVLTAGRDGKIHCWDIRAAEKTFELGSARSAAFLSLASCYQNTTLAAGTELSNSQASVEIWDPRSPREPIARYVESHNDDVTQLAFHPAYPSCLLSGSTDGLVNIYDIRITDEDDALSQVINHGASIAHAGFLTNTKIHALSHDEMLSIYHLNQATDNIDDREDPPPIVFGDLRPKSVCEYVVNVLPFGEGAIVGAGTHSEHRLDLIALSSASGWAIDESQTIRLAGALGEEIVRSFYIDSRTNIIYTSGEDGLVRAWQISNAEGEAHEAGPKRHRRTKEIRKEQQQYKPY